MSALSCYVQGVTSRSTSRLFLLAAFAVAVGSERAHAAAVVYATAADAYLDVGRVDGVTVGQKISLIRRKKTIGTCEVRQVATQQSVCHGQHIRPGDRFTLPRVAAADAAPPTAAPPGREVKQRVALPSAAEQAERRAIAEKLPIDKFAYEGGTLFADVHGKVIARQQLWMISTTPDSTYARPSLDAAFRAGFGWGFAAGALRVVGDIFAPPDQRFRPEERVELYVWGLSAGASLGPVVGEVGRFMARKAAGTLVLDGAQVGVRLFDETTEVGVYAGAIPDLLTLIPSVDRLTAGTYAGVDVPIADSFILLPRLRAGAVSTGELDRVRGDVEAQLIAQWIRIASLGASSRVAIGGDAGVTLEGARTDLDVNLLEPWRVSASYRFTNTPGYDFDAKNAVLPVNAAHHATLGTSFVLFSQLSLGALGGAGLDVATETARYFVGPEIAWSPSLGALRGIQAGYFEELGTWTGRSAYTGTTIGFDLIPILWTTRLSYFESEAYLDSFREFGLYTSVDAPVLPWLIVRTRVYGQQALASFGGDKRRIPSALFAELSVGGVL